MFVPLRPTTVPLLQQLASERGPALYAAAERPTGPLMN
jgi:hypothetical protein